MPNPQRFQSDEISESCSDHRRFRLGVDRGGIAIPRHLSLASDPWLGEHRIGGVPVLPLALAAEMAAEAAAQGVGDRGIAALMGTSYSKATISADRNQKSFKYSLEKFLNVRGADTIVAQGRKRLAKNPDLYAGLERAYGVPARVVGPVDPSELLDG